MSSTQGLIRLGKMSLIRDEFHDDIAEAIEEFLKEPLIEVVEELKVEDSVVEVL